MTTRTVSLGLLAAWMALLLIGTALGAETEGPQPAAQVASRIDNGRPPASDERALRRSHESGAGEQAPAWRGYTSGDARLARSDGAACPPGSRSVACVVCVDYVVRAAAAAEKELARPGSDARNARQMALVLIEALGGAPSGERPAESPFTGIETPCQIS